MAMRKLLRESGSGTVRPEDIQSDEISKILSLTSGAGKWCHV
jgi:hypothetical protein